MVESKLEPSQTYKRKIIEYQNVSERFQIASRNYQQQYAAIYSNRLKILRRKLMKKIPEKWGNIPLLKMQDLETEENKNKECIITGTVYKDQILKPSILKEISAEHNLPLQPIKKYTSDSDCLVLEDELQRIKLEGNIDLDDFVTGVVAAFCGECIEGGSFKIKEWLAVGPVLPIERPMKSRDLGSICLISGINMSSSFETCVKAQLLLDFLNGLCDDCVSVAKVSRLIVAGDILSMPESVKQFSQTSKVLTRHAKVQGLEYLKLADDLFSQIAMCIDVDVMPGKNDPSNFQLPQQSFHPCLFPEAGQYQSFHLVTNPYEFIASGVRILGSSGQNVTDISKYTDVKNPIDLLEKIVNWGHIAPTCPDTLGCYPFGDSDPLVIQDGVNVYFAGNQPKFDEKLVKVGPSKIKLISLPKFSETGSVVLLDLNSLECRLVTMSVAFK